MDQLCRLCGKEKSRMRPIFEKNNQNQNRPVAQILEDIVRLNIEPDDGLPQKICRLCDVTLLEMNESVEQFREIDQKLRKQLPAFLVPEIKLEDETEMEVEALEEICHQKLKVEDLKMEALEEEPLMVVEETMEEVEYLDLDDSGSALAEEELKDEQEANDEPETNESKDLKPMNTNDCEEIEEEGDDEDEWKPSKDDVENAKLEDPNKTKQKRKRPSKKDTEKEQTPKRTYRKGGTLLPRSRKKEPEQLQKNDFKCYICDNDQLGSAEALFAHLNDHTDHIPYNCTECVMEEVVIKAVSTLNLHKRMHLNPFKCPMCDKRYPKKESVRLHIQMYHTEHGSLTCEVCGKVFPSKMTLRAHMKQHTSGTPCEYCGKKFAESSKLKKHIDRTHIGIKHECHLCHKKLSSLEAVQAHILMVHSTEEFKCTVCPRTYTSEISLRAHLKKHEENPEYVPARNWQDYYTFVEGAEGLKNGVRLKKCKLCGEIKSQIGGHLHAVHFPTLFRCEQCNETFKQKRTYEMHVLEHTSGKAYKCPICGREFTMRRNLISHLKTKKHRDHPLAQKLDWIDDELGIKERRMEALDAAETMRNQEAEQAVEEIEVFEDNSE